MRGHHPFNHYFTVAARMCLPALVISSAACDESRRITGPNPAGLALAWVTPRNGTVGGQTTVTIGGTGFQTGATLSFGGMAAVATVSGSTRIVFVTPPHPAGIVDVVVTNPDGQQARLPAAFTYLGPPPGPAPSVTEVSLNTGSTGGGATVVISGSGFVFGATVTFDGIPVHLGALRTAHLFDGKLYVQTPPHAAGSVAVVVTNPDGQTATLPDGYTYVPPGTIDFNGEWDGGTGTDWQTPVPFTIRDNVVVSASCGGVPIALPDPLPAVRDGEFVIQHGPAVLMTGRIVTATFATGQVSAGPCVADTWVASKRTPAGQRPLPGLGQRRP